MSSTPPAPGDDTREARRDRAFFGQPLALTNLFGVEMWERFSFYGMQGILLIYLYYQTTDGGLGISEHTATGIVGAYGGMVYISTIVGGWIADRVLGGERTLFYSAILVMGGHIALSVLPGLLGVGVGLILVAFGSGGVKATATSLVGDLYDEDDERRDAGFSLFYMGINIGGLVGPLLTGLLRDNAGFHWGFGLAAIGMALGLIQYTVFRRNLHGVGGRPSDPLGRNQRLAYAGGALIVVVIVAVLSVTGIITADRLSDIVVGIATAATIIYFLVILTSRQVTPVERRRVVAFVPMFIASVVFWSLFQQIFTVLTIYSDKRLDRNLFGWEFPVSWVQSIEPVWVVVGAGAFAAMWTKMGERQPATPIKFALGTGGMGVAFLLFLLMPAGQNTAPVWALVLILGVFAASELMLSPVGLSLATKLAPRAFHTQMVALFFLSVALGTALSGTLARYYDESNEAPYFATLGLVAVAVGVALAIASPGIKKLMSGVK
ncbi:peptide MFS transporter [Tomitella fengzijianii]|uniref:Peptide MFS transporter n=1 Tax=Tomitella fengzijianii TaxID=2597660 RepID=A0A516X625_9ACTN|nr:peptide MFS transporter [Tomitella fengzijianii]QDQ98527.1 peptide MFS transporter [Tomitella fengzijianii]